MLKFNNKFNFLVLLLLLFTAISTESQIKPKKTDRNNFSRIELSFNIGYSRPLLEAFGGNLSINSAEDQIFIDGKRLLISDRLGAKNGFTVQTFFKYRIINNGLFKALFNLGYNNLFSSQPGPSDYSIGVRIQSFSVGIGTEIAPLGINSSFFPSLFILGRTNFMGGETFHKAGLDFFKVTPRYGYSTGINLNFKLKYNIDLYTALNYSFDNASGRKTDEKTPNDAHVIVFRDAKSETNGLTGDRRVAYWALALGMNFYFK